MQGIIYKGIGGFYTVKTDAGQLVQCKPRGVFRNRGIKPLAGDKVLLDVEADTLYICDILPRTNAFVRPAVANADQMIVIASTVQPSPSFLVLDKLFAVVVDADVTPVLVITKNDLAEAEEILGAYSRSGILVMEVNALTGEGMDDLRATLCGKLSVLCGNSGVGKSTLMNALCPQAERETGKISNKLGRGRHTTREVEIVEIGDALVADTPGFASFDVQRAAPIASENMQFAFPEIRQRVGHCKFSGCMHIAEPGCAVRLAVEKDEIALSRYNNYVTLCEQAKEAENNYG